MFVILRKAARPALGPLALVLVAAVASIAGTVDEYRSRVEKAQQVVSDIRTIVSKGETDRSVEIGKIRSLNELIPPNESVDWPGASVETNNSWLQAETNSYLDEKDGVKRQEILNGIGERLDALEQALSESGAARSGEHSKDEDKVKLAEILNRQEYQKPDAGEESLFQQLRRKILEWLAKLFPKFNIQPRQPSDGMGSLALVLQILLYIALAAALGYLMYKIFPTITGRKRRQKKGNNSERIILGERISDDHSASDLFAEAERLARAGELRLAIRKGYIALLCDLGDRKVIGLARNKTNRDYLRDLRSKGELFENVTGLTGSFERHWYGAQASDEADWENFRTLYLRTVRNA